MSVLFRKLTAEEEQRFRIIKKDASISDGVTSVLIAELLDVVEKFGEVDTNGSRSLYSKRDPEMGVLLTQKESKFLMVVGASEMMNNEKDPPVIFCEDGDIVWTKFLSVEMVEQFIQRTDAYAFKKGWINTSTGARIKQDIQRIFPDDIVPQVVELLKKFFSEVLPLRKNDESSAIPTQDSIERELLHKYGYHSIEEARFKMLHTEFQRFQSELEGKIKYGKN